MRKFLIPVLLSFVCFSCSTNNDREFDKLIYEFHDSSVPPEYHRSYTIVMTANGLSKMVDSYGDTISYVEIKTTPEDFQKLTASVTEANLQNCERTVREGCSGGTGISIHLYKNNQKVFSGYHAKCGGQDEGNLCGDHEKILKKLNTWVEVSEKSLRN